MPQSIPPGLKKEHVVQALHDLDSGIDHPFGIPTGYELVYGDKRCAPKAVVGLACRHNLGRVLQPDEFSGTRPLRLLTSRIKRRRPCKLMGRRVFAPIPARCAIAMYWPR